MPRALGPPPNQRPNWPRLNRGQRLYAYREWNKARRRRNLPNVPFPENSPYAPEVSPVSSANPTPAPSQPDPSPDIEVDDSVPDNFFDASFNTDELPANSPLFSQGDSPFRADVPDIPDSEEDDDYPPDNQMAEAATPHQSPSSSGLRTPTSNPNKRTKLDRQKASLPGTGGGGIDTAGMDPVPIERPFSSSNTQVRVYKKVHRFISFGLAYKQIDIDRTTTSPAAEWTDCFMVTPLAEVPWDRLFMYMNASELDLLPKGSRVVHMELKIRSENVRIAFPTNASTSNLATLNQNKFLRTAVGLRQHNLGVNIKPKSFVADKPMEVEAIEELAEDGSDYNEYIKNFYGLPNTEDDFAKVLPRHQVGMPMPFLTYYSMVTQKDDQQNSGWPCLQQYVKEVEADSTAGETIIHMSYKPSLGFIKQPLENIYTGIPSKKEGLTNVTWLEGTGSTNAKVLKIDFSKNLPTTRIEANVEADSDFGIDDRYGLNQIIEKSQCALPHFAAVDFRPKTIPSVHVGLQPVIALTTSVISNDSVNNYTDAQAYFEVTCECHVEVGYPTYRPHATKANTSLNNMIWHIREQPISCAPKYSMVNGLYQAYGPPPRPPAASSEAEAAHM